jgi:hypothetical protein
MAAFNIKDSEHIIDSDDINNYESKSTSNKFAFIISREQNIPNLSTNIRSFTSHEWGESKFIYSPLKKEYQVDGIPFAHYGIKDILIVGACPVTKRTVSMPFSNKRYIKDETHKNLNKLIQDHGITVFMSLMDECDEINGTEDSEFRPYSKLDLPIINSNVKFLKLGIKDCNITDDESILNFARKAVELLKSGEKIYLHCWGGHGRAGTLYCIILYLLYDMDATDILNHCQCIHDCRVNFITVSSPQTLIQTIQVRRIIDSLRIEFQNTESKKIACDKFDSIHEESVKIACDKFDSIHEESVNIDSK